MDKPFRQRGWDVLDVDRDGTPAPGIQVDLTTWDYAAAYPQGYFDAIWA